MGDAMTTGVDGNASRNVIRAVVFPSGIVTAFVGPLDIIARG